MAAEPNRLQSMLRQNFNESKEAEKIKDNLAEQEFKRFKERVLFLVSQRKPVFCDFDISQLYGYGWKYNHFADKVNFDQLEEVLSLIVKLNEVMKDHSFKLFSIVLKGFVLCDSAGIGVEDYINEQGKKKLLDFLARCNPKSLENWNHHLLYVNAQYFAFPEINKYIPKIDEWVQKDFTCPDTDWNDGRDAWEIGTILYLTKHFERFIINPHDFEGFWISLLKNGANIFICQKKYRDRLGEPGSRNSCLMNNFYTTFRAHTASGELFYALEHILLPSIERGVGFLKPAARFNDRALYDVHSQKREILNKVIEKLFMQEKIKGIDVEKEKDVNEFVENLLKAEIVFKVSNSHRLIFNMAEFIEYLENHLRFSPDEKEVVDTMTACVNRLNPEQLSHLAVGFKDSLNAIPLHRAFVGAVLHFCVHSIRLPNHTNGGVAGLIGAYVSLRDFMLDSKEKEQSLAGPVLPLPAPVPAPKPFLPSTSSFQTTMALWKAREQQSQIPKPSKHKF